MSAPLPGGGLRGLIPGPASAEGLTRRGHSMPDTEDAAAREGREQLLRDDPIVLQQVLQGREEWRV